MNKEILLIVPSCLTPVNVMRRRWRLRHSMTSLLHSSRRVFDGAPAPNMFLNYYPRCIYYKIGPIFLNFFSIISWPNTVPFVWDVRCVLLTFGAKFKPTILGYQSKYFFIAFSS